MRVALVRSCIALMEDMSTATALSGSDRALRSRIFRISTQEASLQNQHADQHAPQ